MPESVADFKRFLVMAQGSCDEVRVWLSFAYDFGYLSADKHRRLAVSYEEVGRMLNGLVKAWRGG